MLNSIDRIYVIIRVPLSELTLKDFKLYNNIKTPIYPDDRDGTHNISLTFLWRREPKCFQQIEITNQHSCKSHSICENPFINQGAYFSVSGF